MFETVQRDPRRPVPVGTRLPGNTGYEAHTHSPQRLASGDAGKNFQGLLTSEIAGPPAYLSRSQEMSIKASSSQPNGLVSARTLSRDEDPFMGLGSASNQWRSKARSNSTDETMPDFESNSLGHSRASTEMSVMWPKRDFQRHMDEAAVDEIVQALSPEKRDQLMEALSPVDRSSSGIAPPSNTPKTAEGSKQSSPMLKIPSIIASRRSIDFDRLATRRRSTSSDSGSSGSPLGVSKLGGSGNRDRSDPENTIVTRSQKLRGSVKFRGTAIRQTNNRERSGSDVSKRRKISLSPTTNAKTTPKITLRISPNSGSSEKENQQMERDDSGGDGVSITAE